MDETARKEIEKKFKSDLDKALSENPLLGAFLFFTNVDLTPKQIDDLKKYARDKNLKIIDIFDMERIIFYMFASIILINLEINQ